MFDSSMVNEPSGFEPLKFYCIKMLLELRLLFCEHCPLLLYISVRFRGIFNGFKDIVLAQGRGGGLGLGVAPYKRK